jgi:hypothetical protein
MPPVSTSDIGGVVSHSPPPCSGQKTNRKYASTVVAISKKPKTLCVPAFRGFGGYIGFPAAKPPGMITLQDSTTYINFRLPKLNSHAPIFYLQWVASWAITLGKKVPESWITGKRIVPGQTYTAFGRVAEDAKTLNLRPCYAVATKSIYGGAFSGLGSLFADHKGAFFIWSLGIYPGKEASSHC